MKKRAARIFGILILLAIVAVAAFIYYGPVKKTAEGKIKSIIEDFDIRVKSLDVKQMSDRKTIITDIKLGDDRTLDIARVTARYKLQNVLRGTLQNVDIEKVDINIYKHDGHLQVGGLEKVMGKKEEVQNEDSGKPLYLDPAAMNEIISEYISIRDLNIGVESKPYIASVNDMDISTKFENGKMKMTISSDKINISGLPEEVPTLKLEGDVSLNDSYLSSEMEIADKTKSYNMEMALEIPTNNPDKGVISIRRMQLPWGGGRIFINNLNIPSGFDKPIKAVINLDKVKLAELMAKISEGKIKADGVISGSLPVIYHPDGTIELLKGSAKALADGTISVPADMIPGDNAQIDIARTTLENFHYTQLKISVSSDVNKRSAINLSLEGKNPEALDGRPVKLNVSLAGDIIPLLQQSILPLNNVGKLLNIKDPE